MAAGVDTKPAAVEVGWLIDVVVGIVVLGAVVFAAVVPELMGAAPNRLVSAEAVFDGVEFLGKLENNEVVLPGVAALDDAEPRPENKPAPPVPVVVAFDCPGFAPKDGNVEELVVGAEVLLRPANRLGAVPGAVEEGVLKGFPAPAPNKEGGLGPPAGGA